MEAKQVGLTKDAGWEMGIRKTFAVPAAEVWNFIMSPEGLKLWLGSIKDDSLEKGDEFKTRSGIEGKITVLKPFSHLRMTWKKKEWSNVSILQVRVLSSKYKSTISFHQEKLKNKSQREEMLKHWHGVIEKLEKKIQVYDVQTTQLTRSESKEQSKTSFKPGKGKSWSDKLNDGKEHQIKVIEKAFADIPAGGKMLIATPRIIDEYVKHIPKGKGVSLQTMRNDLASTYHAEYTCPVTTGIFLRIVSEAAYDELQQGKPITKVTPFWRVIDEHSALAKKLSFGEAFIQEQRKNERITQSSNKGKRS